MKLLTKQDHAVYYLNDKTTKEILYGGAAGGGKSALDALALIERCQMYPKSRWLLGRSKLKTLKETTLNTFFEISSKLNVSNQFRFNDQKNIVFWKNGSEILLKDLFQYPSDKEFDSLGSLEVCGAFVDECNQITKKAWEVVTSRCRYKLNEFDLIPKILGTCNPSKNWTYSEFYKPSKDKVLKPYRKFIQALPSDNPHLHKSYLETLLAMEKNSRERLYYGNWEYDDDPASLMSIDEINNAFTNSFVVSGDKYITADIARFGKDSTVICLWDGLRLIRLIKLSKSSTTNTANYISNLANEFNIPKSQIICDEDGVGGGVVDQLKCIGFVNNSSPINKDNFNNLKSQCYYKLSDYIKLNLIYFKIDDTEVVADLIEELEQVKQYKMDQDGKKQVIPKEMVKNNIGRSPDISDAVMMRMYFVLKPIVQRARSYYN